MLNHLKHILLLFSIFIGGDPSEKPVLHWDFNNSEAVGKPYTDVPYDNSVFQSRSGKIEFVEGVNGKAWRTDGYSSSIHHDFKKKQPGPLTLTGWMALESYPTHTAGIFSFHSDVNGDKKWKTLAINQFGELLIAEGVNEAKRYTLIQEKAIEKFNWVHVAWLIDDTTTTILLNSKKVATITTNSLTSISGLHLGRDTYEDFVHIFPTTYINGVLDEVKLWNRILSQDEIKSEYNSYKITGDPDLNIPESRFAQDHNRPQYHILPAANWTNETHGLIYYDNKYHIFNQKNATNVFLGRINWGHFSSADLVQWTEHRPVLTPEEGYDQLGIWSGHAILDDDGQPVIFYTGGDGETFGMCKATPLDKDLIAWEKDENNPLILGPPPAYSRSDFRDPYVWKEDETWYMIVGYGLESQGNKRGTVLLYRSSDLDNWESLGTLYEGNPEVDQSGVFWEMPVFWKMGDKYILLVNPIPYDGIPAIAIYWVGNFVNEQFVPDHIQPKKLELINRMLSPSVYLDEEGRTTAIAIIPDLIPAEMQKLQGWTHLYSMPRVWDFVNGEIHQSPHPNMRLLRNKKQSMKGITLAQGEARSLTSGSQLEVFLEFENIENTVFGVSFGKSEENKEETNLIIATDKKQITIDHTNSSQNLLIEKRIENGKLKHDSNSKMTLRLFIDHSVIEGFIDDKYGFTTRIFPSSASSNRLEVFSKKGILNVTDIDIWSLNSSNNKTDF